MTAPRDPTDITALVLDELSAEAAAALRHQLDADPELESIHQQTTVLVHAMQQGAPTPSDLLHPAQRQRILHSAAPAPRRALPSGKTTPPALRPVRSAWPRRLSQLAALLTVGGVCFWIGHSQLVRPSVATNQKSPALDATNSATASPKPPPATANRPALAQTDLPPAPPPPSAAPRPVQTAPLATESPTDLALTASPARTPEVAARPPTDPPAFKLHTHLAAHPFTDAARAPKLDLPLEPTRIRPRIKPPSADNLIAAKPAPRSTDPAPPPAPRPPLYIHAWRADTASCPWDSELRLLRITVQLPADQAAALGNSTQYPFEIDFDPNNVRRFRLLGSSDQPAPELRQAGRLTYWFEYSPNGALRDRALHPGRRVASIRIPNVRFTTTPVGPFDDGLLTAEDRGIEWTQARSDFRLEAARLGLALLLQGSSSTGNLNADLILKILPPASGPLKPERDRLANALRQLATLVGSH
ncbi:MAG: hypothetical protein KDK99_04905 [Verrucomicrobiales bacterium]|nr:hypothetical protein [Verrucomicrobiales bacterium]